MQQPIERATEATVLTDIRIPFWRLVALLVKVAIAAIPAAIILTIILAIAGAIATAILAALGGGLPVPGSMRL